MTHQLFTIERKPVLDAAQIHRAEYVLEKLLAAEEVGVGGEADRLRRELLTIEKGGLLTTPPLTEDEMRIWSAWLPTKYTSNVGRGLDHYNFDRIPGPVLKKWQAHKKAGDFDSYEIWTPEVHRPDPILLGVNGNARHLIARWGESDANLMTFEDIKSELARRWHRVHRQLSAYVAPAFTMVTFIGTCVISSLRPEDSTPNYLFVFGIPLLAGLLYFVGSQLYFKLRAFGRDEVMQTIMRHRSIDREILAEQA